MKITFNQYIANPMGAGNSVMSNRAMYETMYKKKLDALWMRENGKIDYFLFKDSDKRYFVYIKVPSEKVKNFYYDVVIEFFASDPNIIASNTISKYNVKFYSNDPAFAFNFGYAFIKNGIFVDDLETKMAKMVRTTAATTTNKKNEIGYVKSIYFAYLIMKAKGLFLKQMFDTYGRKYSKTTLLQMVQHSNQKLASRQSAEADEKKDEQLFNKLQRDNPLASARAVSSTRTTTVTKTSNTKTVGFARTVKRI